MTLSWLDWVGNKNPQFLREIKGRLKPRNTILAVAISLLGQFLLLMTFQSHLPVYQSTYVGTVVNRYCAGKPEAYGRLRTCVRDALGDFVIDWHLWWLDLFTWLSIIGCFSLLVAGTYLLINDLATEERRDTLNFLRLSPQSASSILFGKLLGVPILLYLIGGLVIPLHLWSGQAAGVSLGLIFSFYGVLVASCLCFYSCAMLFALASRWLVGFQPWLGSGTVLIFLTFATCRPIQNQPVDWLSVFSPSVILPHLESATGIDNEDLLLHNLHLEKLTWFDLPIGTTVVGTISLVLLNYGLWAYWSWQALNRRFPNPSKTMLSKGESYLLVGCFQFVALGFALQPNWLPSLPFHILSSFNLVLFLGLIAALTPSRQALQDWARYRRQRSATRRSLGNHLIQELIWGEKSPTLVAIVLNLVITFVILAPAILFWSEEAHKLAVFSSLVISLSLILIYAAIAQVLLFLRTQRYALWMTGTLGAVIALPPIILSLLSLQPAKYPVLWLFTAFPWVSTEYVNITTVLLTLVGQLTILAVLSLQITRQLNRAGASAAKALFAST